MNKTIKLAARGFAILFIIMMSLFAFDVDPFSWTALFMHLLPSLALLVVFLISLSQTKIGGILWILIGFAYIIIFRGNDVLAYLIISGPSFIIGILFLLQSNNKMHVPKPAMSKPEAVAAPPEKRANNS